MNNMTWNLMSLGAIWAVFGMAATLIAVGIQRDNPHQVQLPFWANCLIGFLVPVALVCLPVIVPVVFAVAFFVSIYQSVFPKREARDD